MILDTTTKSLQIGMTEAITTTGPDYSAEWIDQAIERKTPGSQLGVCTELALTAVPPPPAANSAGGNTLREIDELNICNLDTVSHTIEVSVYDSSISAVYTIHKSTIASGQNLHYNQYNGWEVL